MKQKIVIKVSMSGHKCRSKALKISVGVSGVESAALKGDDKNQIEVTGEGVDVVALAKLIRKNVGHAEVVSVGPVKKKDEEKDEVKVHPLVWSSYYPYGGGAYPIYQVPSHDPSCSIL